MATKKVTKKTTKPATKKKTTSKPKTTSRATKSRKVSKVESFKLASEKIPFTSVKITEQTLYWGILFIYIFALSLWVLSIQLNIMNIINSVSTSI